MVHWSHLIKHPDLKEYIFIPKQSFIDIKCTNIKRKIVEVRDLDPLEHFCGWNSFHPWRVVLMPSSWVAAEDKGKKVCSMGRKSSTLRNILAHPSQRACFIPRICLSYPRLKL